MTRVRLFSIVVAIIIAAVAAWWFVPPDVGAQSIVDICTDEGELCYEKEIPKLYPEQSLADVFKLIREVRPLDPKYQFCHVAAHKLGEAAVAEDPSRWLDLIPLNPSDGLCSNGFIHGVIVGKFRNDVLDEATLEKTIPDFRRACEPQEDWSPSPLDQAICYHGMGHLFMFVTNADISRSLDTCARVSTSRTGDFGRVCREGVFMQIYQPLEPDDFALIELLPEKPSAQNYRRMCAKYGRDAAEVGACLREAWPLHREDILYTKGAAAFCSGQPNAAEENACYESVFSIIGRQLLSADDDAAIAACAGAPESRIDRCFAAVAQAYLEENRMDGRAAISVCTRAGANSAPCMQSLAQRAPWIFGTNTEAREALCVQLPVEYQTPCRR